MSIIDSQVATTVTTVRYEADQKANWDRWIGSAKNGHFMFFRDYMDYHKDRFADHSLLFYQGDTIIGAMPATERTGELISHGGLTFGGVITGEAMRTPLMLELFKSLLNYLQTNRFDKLRYKAIPFIYHTIPSDEDLYALFRHDARIVRRDASSSVRMDYRLAYSKGRKYSLKLAQKNGLCVQKSSNFADFMALEAEILARKYDTRPVHTAEEISLLASRFPENIELFVVLRNEELLAGVITYSTPWVSHAQYMAASDEGKAVGAIDLIVDTLLREHCHTKRYFDFGISTENDGRYLNDGLISQKEMFGARTVLYDTYELDLH